MLFIFNQLKRFTHSKANYKSRYEAVNQQVNSPNFHIKKVKFTLEKKRRKKIIELGGGGGGGEGKQLQFSFCCTYWLRSWSAACLTCTIYILWRLGLWAGRSRERVSHFKLSFHYLSGQNLAMNSQRFPFGL